MTDSGQLQPDETLVDRGVDDVLDEGFSPPERLRGSTAKGVTAAEQREGETFEERLAQEEPDTTDDPADGAPDDALESGEPGEQYAGDDRSGRLVAPDGGTGVDDVQQQVAEDVGIDGGAAGAEEAAVHVWTEEQTARAEDADENPADDQA